MNTFLLLLSFLTFSFFLGAEEAPDYLRFKNGDTLHGKYQGLDEGPLVKWLSYESKDSISFETRNLRKLSLNNGRAKSQITSKGLVELSNGDKVPGTLTSMGGDSVSLQTEFAGLLTIPRKYVSKIFPNRHGGGVLYAGPFNDQSWHSPGNLAPPPEEDENQDLLDGEEDEKWVHAGGAWYSNSSDILRLDTTLPDLVSVRFQLSWQAPLNANIAMFADFQRPPSEPKARVRRVPNPDEEVVEEEVRDEQEDQQPQLVDIMEVGAGMSDPQRFGSGYLVSVLSSYSRLQRLGFDKNQRDEKKSFPNSGGRLNLSDLYSAEFEIRASRKEGSFSLFVNGEFYSEWHDLAEPLEKKHRYFAISAGGKSRLRISDVVVSEWNGMPDSARSMKTEERDVLLLANGTDRISGEILTLEEDLFRVQSNYGVFQIPLEEVTDIQLAGSTTEEAPLGEDGQVLVSFQPNGLLSFLPKEGSANSLDGKHTILGELSLDLNYAYLFEFDPIGSIFDNWDDEF